MSTIEEELFEDVWKSMAEDGKDLDDIAYSKLLLSRTAEWHRAKLRELEDEVKKELRTTYRTGGVDGWLETWNEGIYFGATVERGVKAAVERMCGKGGE